MPVFVKATRRGVYYDLAASPYKVHHMGFTFKFSSKSHQEKFKLRLPAQEDEFSRRMFARWGLRISRSVIPALILYRQIETRGFRLTLNASESGLFGGASEVITDPDEIKISLKIGMGAG